MAGDVIPIASAAKPQGPMLFGFSRFDEVGMSTIVIENTLPEMQHRKKLELLSAIVCDKNRRFPPALIVGLKC